MVKLTDVKYILPKRRNRWGDEELRRQAERRPLRFYKDIHRRGIRGEIGEDELAGAGAVIEGMLDRLDATLEGPDRRQDWIAGDFSLADIAIAPCMYRLVALGRDRFWSADKRPNVHAWYSRLSARPAFDVAVSWPDESGGRYEEVGLSTKRPAVG